MPGVRGKVIGPSPSLPMRCTFQPVKGWQGWLGSMLSVLAQRRFVELARLFGASHLAEGQRVSPVVEGSTKNVEMALVPMLLAVWLPEAPKSSRFSRKRLLIVSPPGIAFNFSFTSCVMVASFKYVIVRFFIRTSACCHAVQHTSSS